MSPRVIFTNGNISILQDLLYLVGIRVTLDEMRAWSAEQLNQAGHWAAFAHIVPAYGGTIPPKPEFLHTQELSNETR